jgi:hypothetical protein
MNKLMSKAMGSFLFCFLLLGQISFGKMVTLSADTQNKLIQNINNALNNPATPNQTSLSEEGNDLPSSIQLGMNGVPVFDQGWEWSSCTTMSVTAALDALYSLKGDQAISPTCFLQLDNLEWWNGNDLFLVVSAFEHFGYWTQKDQETIKVNGVPACGGLTKYPFSDKSHFGDAPSLDLLDPDTFKKYQAAEEIQRNNDGGNGTSMPVSVYQQYEKHALKSSNWLVIATHYAPQQADQTLQQVKESLTKGNRLVFSMFFDPFLSDKGHSMGAIGSYHAHFDTWVLTNQIGRDVQTYLRAFQHEMVITGYDDTACVTYDDESQTRQECGLLKIRNSGGAELGDHGDFYMSYDYFKTLANGWVIAIGRNPSGE